jgi:hypothetical protein
MNLEEGVNTLEAISRMSFEGARLQPCRKYPIKINGF